MWPYILLAAGLFFVVIFGGSYLYIRHMRRTALILVHPWHLGETREDFDQIFVGSLRHLGARVSSQQRNSIFSRYTEYRERLKSFLERQRYVYVVLFDEGECIERSFLELSSLTPRFWRRICRVFEVATRGGRAVPRNCTWDNVLDFLKLAGVQKLHVAGTFLGKYRGQVVHPSQMYFCVNDVYFHIVESKQFNEVTILEPYCFVEEVDSLKASSAMRAKTNDPGGPPHNGSGASGHRKLSSADRRRKKRRR